MGKFSKPIKCWVQLVFLEFEVIFRFRLKCNCKVQDWKKIYMHNAIIWSLSVYKLESIFWARLFKTSGSQLWKHGVQHKINAIGQLLNFWNMFGLFQDYIRNKLNLFSCFGIFSNS